MGFFTINKKLLPIKFHYGLFNAGTSTVQPTMPVYARVLGFSSFVVGTIYTILPILGLFIKPIFGAIADKFKWHRGVLLAWELIIVVAYFSIQFIPADKSLSSPISPEGWQACSSLDSNYVTAQFGESTWKCDLNDDLCSKWNITDYCAIYNVHNTSTIPGQEQCFSLGSAGPKTAPVGTKGCEAPDSYTYGQWQFWLFLLLLLGAWNGTSVVTTITDTLCIEICGDALLYGQQRLWGSLGWGVFALISGFVIDAFSTEGEEKNYTPAFYFMLVPLVVDLVISYSLKFSIPQQSENIVKDVWRVLLKPKNAIFTFWCAMVGVSFGLMWNFFFWLLEDLAKEYGSDVTASIKTLEGLIIFIQTVPGEAPAFYMGGWVVSTIGHSHSMSVVLAGYGLRFVIYSLLVNPWWSLPVELLHYNHGLFFSTMTSYAKIIGPPGTEATIQSLLCAICEGIGVAIGSFLAGHLYDTYGGSATFQIFGIAFLIMAAANECIELIFKYLERNEAKVKSQEKKISPKISEVTILDNLVPKSNTSISRKTNNYNSTGDLET